ncbi:hypothetical protein DFH06DRAFT_1338052 [Mycena polygramma]|nr:hypothetical protein DFH06DRAFT_1338052 [Mycena polygramma]
MLHPQKILGGKLPTLWYPPDFLPQPYFAFPPRPVLVSPSSFSHTYAIIPFLYPHTHRCHAFTTIFWDIHEITPIYMTQNKSLRDLRLPPPFLPDHNCYTYKLHNCSVFTLPSTSLPGGRSRDQRINISAFRFLVFLGFLLQSCLGWAKETDVALSINEAHKHGIPSCTPLTALFARDQGSNLRGAALGSYGPRGRDSALP